ncbi:MAG: hypothetical protein ABIR70_18455 [Bryobacteraceae bacterium]
MGWQAYAKLALGLLVAMQALDAQTATAEYLLDGSETPSLSLGLVVPSPVPAKSIIRTAKELEKRIKKLPRGSHLTWVPHAPALVDEKGEKLLIASGVLHQLELLCEERGISFKIISLPRPEWSISPIL